MTTIETMYAPQVNSPATTLSANISSSATSISVLSGATLPAAPNLLVIGGDTENAETVRMTAKSGNTITVVRGVQGTARAWNTGALIARLFTAKDLADVQTNITNLDSGKAEKTDLNAANDRIDDVYANSASGSIATFERITGGMPVNSLEIAITPKQAGSGDPSPTNVRAISGWTGASVTRTGKNLLQINNITEGDHTYQGVSCNLTNGVLTFNGRATANADIVLSIQTSSPYLLAKAGDYALSGGDATLRLQARIRGGAANRYIVAGEDSTTFTLAEGEYVDRVYVTVVNGTTYSATLRPMIRRAGNSADFEPYASSTTSISWNTEAGTVYGGTLDVTAGLLTVTYVKDSVSEVKGVYGAVTNGYCVYLQPSGAYRKNCDPTMMVSNKFKYSSSGRNSAPLYAYGGNDGSDDYVVFILPNTVTSKAEANAWFTSNPTDYTYQLATPLTYSLTPEQVSTLQGTNNIWADTGDVIEVTFGEDIKQYIDAENADKQDEIIVSGILKGDGAGGISAAVAGTDYQAPLIAGTDYQTPLDEKALQWYGVCSTSASTQAKTVSITGITALTEGLEIRVKMTNAQTYNGTPTLNVNSLGAKTIKQHGSTDAVRYQWQAGEILSLTYDGTYWTLENNSLATTTYFGLTRLSSSTSSTDESMAATPKAVKTAYDLADAAIPATEKGTNVATLVTAADSTTPSVPRITPAQSFAPLFTITADTTLAAKHAGGILVCTNSPTITIPSTGFSEATQIEILNYGTGVVTIAGASGCSVNGTSAGSVTLADQYKSAVLLAISASQWVIQGAIE